MAKLNLKISGLVMYRGPSQLNRKPIVAIATGLLHRSRNEKTGKLIQLYILPDNGESPLQNALEGADKAVCGNCKHMGTDGKLGSCYVNLGQGPNAVYDAYQRGSYTDFAEEHLELFRGRKIRFGTYGDPAAIPLGIIRKLAGVLDSWTGYTHQWKRGPRGLRKFCMASCDTLAEKEEAQALGWRTFRVRQEHDPIQRDEFVCPASNEAGKRLQCATCMACCGVLRSPQAVSPTIVLHGLDWKLKLFQAAVS